MTFLHPLALLGLAAAAIPILLHLFQRRSPPELEFPAVRYLAEAERRSARHLRLRHLLLLLLRTLLITVIVLAAARPLVPLEGRGSAHPPTALAVVLDNSASSGVTAGGRPALDRLRDVARASLAEAGATDRLFLLLADGVVRAGTREELLATIDSARAVPLRLDLVAAVQRAAGAVAAEPFLDREVHVVSDLQRAALADGRVDVPDGVRILVLAPSEGGDVPNRGIGSAVVRDGAVAVTVVGTPGAPAAPVTLVVRGRDAARALAGAGDAVALALPALPPGWWAGEVRLAPDELRVDDMRPVVWRVAPPARATADPTAGVFVAAALDVLRDGGRIVTGDAVRIGAAPAPGAVVLPPADPALVGAANRALAAAGAGWRFAGPGTPGVLDDGGTLGVTGLAVRRRQRLEGAGGEVVATVHGEPWLVRTAGMVLLASRLDTAWTALPATPAFVPFVDRLVSAVTRGERPVGVEVGAPGITFDVRGRDTVGATVSAPDARESDLTAATAGEVRRALGAAPLDERALAAARFGGARRADLSGALLVVALLLGVMELTVAWRTR